MTTNEELNNSSLRFLYDISCQINAAESYPDLLQELLQRLCHQLDGYGAIIRLISEEGWMDLLSSYGLEEDKLTELQHTPIDGALFTRNRDATKAIRLSTASRLMSGEKAKVISIPVRHQVHTLGVLNVFIDSSHYEINREQALMLLSFGQHLGLIIEKHRLDNVTKQKLIQEERNMIANELHDSLAQTLASLRFQVRILDETLQPTSEYMAIMSIEQVEHGLDEAYTDLRELIAHCRVPIEQQGLLPSIDRVVSKFREETGIHILLQCECQAPDVPANVEMNVYRIVQEALTNIKKHAEAHIVRVLLSCDEQG